MSVFEWVTTEYPRQSLLVHIAYPNTATALCGGTVDAPSDPAHLEEICPPCRQIAISLGDAVVQWKPSRR